MNKKIIVVLGIAAGALIGGWFVSQASAYSGFGMMSRLTNGMMDSGFNAGSMHNTMNGAFGGMMHDMAGFGGMMNGWRHGKDSEVDMNKMHQRMVSGNLTQEDYSEMKEHCPMMD